MKFTKALLHHALLLLGLFHQADALNDVTITIGETADNKVFMEWTGSLAVLPPLVGGGGFSPGFFSDTTDTSVSAVLIDSNCKCRTDFM